MTFSSTMKNFHQISESTFWELIFSNLTDESTASINNHWAENYMICICKVDSLSLKLWSWVFKHVLNLDSSV